MKSLINALYNKYGDFVRFCLVGITNTIVSLIIYSICLYFGIYYIIASTMGYIGGILNGYILSSKFVFKQRLDGKKGVKFVGIYLTSLLINLAMVAILVELFGINELLAQLLATGFNIIYNYSLNKLWTFKRNR